MKLLVDPVLAETVPDGTFGGARPHRGPRGEIRRWTCDEQTRHREELLADLRQPRTHIGRHAARQENR
ncbi:hypothetical protein [Streptomyces candidus]|uniref:Uncharacterized protein n=1 Tax=Streptomyces candidus TaxID=67283 RepID=A0A7X0HM57_9ACTN|nr:hypothetical protein [Streptomyces candidus]MBB6440252.1 hypothetical protein [Streptomyces candidus]GHH58138.1 hypothetical protein GCM10018773_66200 [Streptomyces candidus]